jgi:hypothetical protein
VSVEEQMVAVLAAHAGLDALINGRCDPLVLPQEPTLPALTYQRIDGPRVGAIGGPSYLASPRIQITAWASTYKAAKQVADQVRDALDGYLGDLGGGNQWMAQLANDLDDYEEATQRYRVILDFVITHGE